MPSGSSPGLNNLVCFSPHNPDHIHEFQRFISILFNLPTEKRSYVRTLSSGVMSNQLISAIWFIHQFPIYTGPGRFGIHRKVNDILLHNRVNSGSFGIYFSASFARLNACLNSSFQYVFQFGLWLPRVPILL